MRPLLATLILLGSCKAIDQKTLAEWMSSETALMQDLEAYRKAKAKDASDITAHLAKPFTQISLDEENLLMTELLADVNADSTKTAGRKSSYASRIQAHLDLYNSLKGN
jgi:hypothetical protein